jgi:hypothetical protein
MLSRRTLALGLMALGALLLAGSVLVYLRAASAPASLGDVAVPTSLAGERQTSQLTGVAAVESLARLHGKDIPLVSGAEAVYGSGAATLWVSGAATEAAAAELVQVMADKIAKGRSPFTPLGTRPAGQARVYELTGMGQQHYYFQAGRLVIWLAASAPLAEAALQETLAFYQAQSGN